MFIRSTGLGRTLLTCKVVKIEVTDMVPSTLEPPEEGEPKEPTRLLMTIQTTDPVNWTVRGFVEPQDLWLILKAAMTPAVIWTALKFLFAGGKDKKKGLVEQAKVGVPEQAKA
ncbi:MAG: hypothetical protein IH608_10895 [Proteobacteria bacterium]|nr:hypothetical protein [Pseudomonadota bacterium]